MFYSLCTDAVYCTVGTTSSLLKGPLKIFSRVCSYFTCEDHGRETMSINFLKGPSGQIRAVFELYYCKALILVIYRYML
jgi:hypothetical protein